MSKPVRKQTPSEQLQWVRRKMDRLHQDAVARGVRGWVIVAAVLGWVRDWERELR